MFTNDYIKSSILSDKSELNDILIQVFEQSLSSIVITDADFGESGHKFIYVNPAFLKMTGYSRNDLIGKTPRILQGEKTDRKVLDKLKREIKRGKFFYGTIINYKKDKSEYYVEWNISPIRNRDNEIIYFIKIAKENSYF